MIINPRTGKPFRRPNTDEIATIREGRDITRGWVDGQHWLAPQDLVLQRQGGGNYQFYEDLLRDDRVASTFAQRRAAVIARQWEVVPGGTAAQDKAAAEFLTETLSHVGWDRVTDGMLFGLLFGFSVAEAIYVRDGRRVALDRIAVRNRRRFVFDSGFRPRLLTSKEPMGEALPSHKFWVFDVGADNDDEPYGRGLGHKLFWPVKFKREGIKFWLTLLDKFGTPTPLGRYPRHAAEQRDKTIEMLTSFISGSVMAVPDDIEVSLLEATRGGTVDYGAFMALMDRAITTIVLSQTMTTDDGSSRSQAEVHLDVRDEIVEADAFLIDDSFSRQVGTWLTRWNFPGAATPTVRRIMETPARQRRRAERDHLIAQMGWRPSARYVEENYGVEVEAAPAPPAPAPLELDEDDDGMALEVLAENARRWLGPKLDEWHAPLREGLDGFASLTDYAAWLDGGASDAVDVGPFARSLGDALAAAVLAGMVDVEAEAKALELAESEAGGRLPFREQIEHFQAKLAVPTSSWADIWLEEHDKAFVVAGAARADLLEALRKAVEAAIIDGETLASFRARFDAIVAELGWEHRGSRDWRTRVIYETNLATSYAAGRWRQMQASTALRPYWRYRHSHASVEPREQHLAWDGLVLRHDDPFWNTNFPPNGFGCKCFVQALRHSDVARMGKSGPDPSPKLDWRVVQIGDRMISTPTGVDPGFAYVPGASGGGGR